MDYKVVTARSSEELNDKVMKYMAEGWTPKGSHYVVEAKRQNVYAGSMLKHTEIKLEYSQTLIKK